VLEGNFSLVNMWFDSTVICFTEQIEIIRPATFLPIYKYKQVLTLQYILGNPEYIKCQHYARY
jgi:hypothetical protein